MRLLLPAGTGPGVTGQWVRVEPAGKASFPCRVSAVGTWAGDSIFIEELVGGLPASLSQFGVVNSPYGPNTDTGTVNPVGQMNPGPPQQNSLVIDEVVEWIRARTGAGLTGTVQVGIEMRE